MSDPDIEPLRERLREVEEGRDRNPTADSEIDFDDETDEDIPDLDEVEAREVGVDLDDPEV
jgi:hypothetical protein